MKTILKKDVKKVWLEEDSICVELKDGRIGIEFFKDYEPLRTATMAQLKNFRLDFDGIWFDDLGEGLELAGFFLPKKSNSIGRIFWKAPELNMAAIARRLGIPQPLFAAYVSGSKKPSEKRRRLIVEEVHKIGRELLAV